MKDTDLIIKGFIHDVPYRTYEVKVKSKEPKLVRVQRDGKIVRASK